MSSPKVSQARLTLALAAAALIAVGERAVQADDRDLLRFNTATPYLFLMLDTSASMNLKIGPDVAAAGHADDPDSRLYGAKEALFAVFKDVDDVRFGFSAFNHDELRVENRHWLYFVESIPGGWPTTAQLGWPLVEPGSPCTVDSVVRLCGLTTFLVDEDTNDDDVADTADAFPDTQITAGDVQVVGESFALGAAPDDAGTCAAPLDLEVARDRQRLNAYPKLGKDGDSTTSIIVQKGPNKNNKKIYELSFRRLGPADGTPGNPGVGSDNVNVLFTVTEVDAATCTVPVVLGLNASAVFNLRQDPYLKDFLMIDLGVAGGGSGGNATENSAALWEWQDAKQTTTCGSSHPFSGKGWEGNYDSGVALDENSPGSGGVDLNWPADDKDTFCPIAPNDPSCIALKPMEDTVLSSFGRAMDHGDMLPFEWLSSDGNKQAFLERLAPNWDGTNQPNFGVAAHLNLLPDFPSGLLRPEIAGREPLIATGETVLGKAMNDFRCWYMGRKGLNASGGKCADNAFYQADAGWSDVACANDPNYGCRKPFLIIISDGDDTCPGENPGADVADMKSFTGVATWALNVGDPKNCSSGGGLHSIVSRTGGECVNVATKQDLKNAIADILGEIRQQARAFASAAVPSVQASADLALYISNFTPINQRSVWDGHLNAFLKPVPDVNRDGIPDTDVLCAGKADQSACFLWDAGTVLETQQYNAADPVGDAINQRRVLYSKEDTTVDTVPVPTRALDPVDCSTPASTEYLECIDLLEGMNIQTADPVAGQNEANSVITKTLVKKNYTVTRPDGSTFTEEFLLGDIFHANPIVVSSPVNSLYFTQDAESDGTACKQDDSGNPGFRCFFARHRFRRRIVVFGSNDGMLHAFNAGVVSHTTKRYDQGTGHELWAYMPRAVLPTVKTLAQGTVHQYSVDGTPAVADVFIDTAHSGAPDPDQRVWRTVLIGGLREGGSAYYALDITQPDPIDVVGADFIPRVGDDEVAACSLPSGCPQPYPQPLWEFTDTTADSILTLQPADPVRLDEDDNQAADLGETWSVPGVGRIRICKAGGSACDPDNPAQDDDLVDVHVAIFGGGMDPADKSNPRQGNWLYMVDIETGKVLYKREVRSPDGSKTGGAIPSQVAAVDTDQDSYLDRIYVGSTGGYMYRVDLTPYVSGAGRKLPAPTKITVNGLNGVSYEALRIAPDDAGTPVWVPVVLFDANFDNPGDGTATVSAAPRAIYHRPSVLFAAKVGRYALAFGTGDREDLWTLNDSETHSERFTLFIDDSDDPSFLGPLPYDEGDFQRIGIADPNLGIDLLTTRVKGKKGWFLPMEGNERVITDSFSLSGVTIFSSFVPDVAITDTGCDPITDPTCPEITGSCGEKTFESDTDNRCAKTGFSRLYVVGSVNGDAFLKSSTGDASRFQAVSAFVTNPYTEPGQSPNDPTPGSEPNSDTLTAAEIDVMNSLKTLFPVNCKFANYRIDIKTVAADLRLQRIAPIPICIIEKNWKEY